LTSPSKTFHDLHPIGGVDAVDDADDAVTAESDTVIVGSKRMTLGTGLADVLVVFSLKDGNRWNDKPTDL
jgi:hypothetical protein